jgi:hypothetical protein
VSVLTGETEPADRSTPPSMIVIGSILFGAFLVLTALTALTVSNGKAALSPADRTDLVLPGGVDLIDDHATCGADACDGQGLVVQWYPITAPVAVDLLADHFERNGWDEGTSCGAEGRCLTKGDLRVLVKPWSAVDPGVGGVMRASFQARGLDQTGFVYLKVTRCGILEEC